MIESTCNAASNEISSRSPVRILVVDDSTIDAELLISIVRSKGLYAIFDHVDLPENLRQCLADKDYDVVLCDHNLESWAGMDALNILRQSTKDIPFIVVTGTLGDERAVEYLKQGASDYVLKEHLERLPSAIDRALREKAQRDENAGLQKAIWESKKTGNGHSTRFRTRSCFWIGNAASSGQIGPPPHSSVWNPTKSSARNVLRSRTNMHALRQSARTAECCSAAEKKSRTLLRVNLTNSCEFPPFRSETAPGISRAPFT